MTCTCMYCSVLCHIDDIEDDMDMNCSMPMPMNCNMSMGPMKMQVYDGRVNKIIDSISYL